VVNQVTRTNDSPIGKIKFVDICRFSFHWLADRKGSYYGDADLENYSTISGDIDDIDNRSGMLACFGRLHIPTICMGCWESGLKIEARVVVTNNMNWGRLLQLQSWHNTICNDGAERRRC
jgi:hypothetical protein